MEHEVVCARRRLGPGSVTERHPGKVLEAVVRFVGEDERADAGVDRDVLLVVAVGGGENGAALHEHVVQVVAWIGRGWGQVKRYGWGGSC